MNEITVSYDQQMAVRISDGAGLVAVPHIRNATSRCRGCGAYALGGLWPSCFGPQAKARLCLARHRKDGLDITWRLKNG